MTRIAIVSTSRSGNTWLRYLLARLYGLEQLAVHTPEALDWEHLPENCVLQLHWHRTPAFAALLAEHGFRVVVLARHPLDVLVSILHFAPHEPETACWLSGEGGDEASIWGKSPASPEFLSYALGQRARALLSVSQEWWDVPGTVALRYEDLVRDTVGALGKLAGQIGPMSGSVTEAVESLSLAKLKPSANNQHFWKGQPDLWKNFFPGEIAAMIAKANESSFTKFGYHCDPDSSLTLVEAERRWGEFRNS